LDKLGKWKLLCSGRVCDIVCSIMVGRMTWSQVDIEV
jgi:hypothetical protein